MDWVREVEELHAFFDAWFRGAADSMERMEAVLASSFTIVGPHGTTMDRDETIEAVRTAFGRSGTLRIRTSDHHLISSTSELVVARYTETHELPVGGNRRLSTVIFRPDEHAPNGLTWLSVHETWIEQ
ncbi:MAG: DUF4440 domain-containing protein [Acidimicrobiia bacterium]|nr:DUF4440 domain-containing protein [Acidimicrobiia bacterium]NNF68857.1 DUF4440 domain-containing protein [Acidimicrobiia bacterium]